MLLHASGQVGPCSWPLLPRCLPRPPAAPVPLVRDEMRSGITALPQLMEAMKPAEGTSPSCTQDVSALSCEKASSKPPQSPPLPRAQDGDCLSLPFPRTSSFWTRFGLSQNHWQTPTDFSSGCVVAKLTTNGANSLRHLPFEHIAQPRGWSEGSLCWPHHAQPAAPERGSALLPALAGKALPREHTQALNFPLVG